MKAAMMLTTDGAAALQLAQKLRAELPNARWTAYVRDDDRELLLPVLQGCDVRRDKPVGSKLRFLRALRAERYEFVVVAWHGGERFPPLRLAALLAGAEDVQAVDERGRHFAVRWWAPWTWAEHFVRRLGQAKLLRILRLCASLWRQSIGRLVRRCVLVPELVRVRARRSGSGSGSCALRQSSARPASAAVLRNLRRLGSGMASTGFIFASFMVLCSRRQV